MREFLIQLVALFLWSLAFFSLYRRQVRSAGPRETASLLNRLFPGRTGCDGGEEENSAKIRFYLVVKVGWLLFAACVLRFFLAPDYYGLLLLLFMTGGAFFCWRYLSRRARAMPAPADWERIYSLPEDYAVFLATLNRKGTEENWIGATLSQLDLRKKNLLVLAILRSERLIVFPKGQEVLAAGDRLLIFGRKEKNS
ncbi:MAG: hypothetical protein GX085_09305 [Firmicutes bacterium]|nr:hypothetical protein [Bacillota bacterium]